MLSVERERQIIDLLERQRTVTVRDLAQAFSVTEVTIRRDLQRLEEQRRLQRTHGGAVAIDHASAPPPSPTDISSDADVLIVSPVSSRQAHTLRANAMRRGIPLIAESSPQEGAVYLGPHNYEAGYEIGVWVASVMAAHEARNRVVLVVTQASLPNTQERSRGFIDGLGDDAAGIEARILTVDGGGLYDTAYQMALDAIRTEPDIAAIFGINDDALLGALSAYRQIHGEQPLLVAANVGGEGDTIFSEIAAGETVLAMGCAALFPTLVGQMSIDAACYLLNGQPLPDAIYTPHRLIVREHGESNIEDYYERADGSWRLHGTARTALAEPEWKEAPPASKDRHIAFVIHYRTHEWYQSITRAMEARADALSIRFSAHSVEEDIAAIRQELRRLIGKLAAESVRDGETVLLDAGSTTAYMAQYLRAKRDLTVVTNSPDVLDRLKNSEVNVMLVGGEYDAASNALVGRGTHLLLGELRVDRLFLVAAGVSSAFGVSSVDAREAEARQHMIHAARSVTVLADHTVLGVDAHYKVCDLSSVQTIITDAGIQAEQSLALSGMGIEVLLAGQVYQQGQSKEVTRGTEDVL